MCKCVNISWMQCSYVQRHCYTCTSMWKLSLNIKNRIKAIYVIALSINILPFTACFFSLHLYSISTFAKECERDGQYVNLYRIPMFKKRTYFQKGNIHVHLHVGDVNIFVTVFVQYSSFHPCMFLLKTILILQMLQYYKHSFDGIPHILRNVEVHTFWAVHDPEMKTHSMSLFCLQLCAGDKGSGGSVKKDSSIDDVDGEVFEPVIWLCLACGSQVGLVVCLFFQFKFVSSTCIR